LKLWVLPLIVLFISGCATYVHIAEIKGRPGEFDERVVTVSGRVSETLSIPFVNKGMYQLDDGTDKIWVMSNQRVPFRGDKVIVEGKVKTGFTIRNRTFGIVIVEGSD
jgi:hypothetical protein